MADLWSKTVGGHGYTVTVYARNGSRFLHLRWWDGQRNQPTSKSLRHNDRDRGEAEALQKAVELQTAQNLADAGVVTLGALLDRFEAERLPADKGQGPAEGRRRIAIWIAALGPMKNVARITTGDLEDFARRRAHGQLAVEGYTLTPKPSLRTVGQDLEFLRRVLNWGRGVSVRGDEGTPMVPATCRPFDGFTIPNTPRPKRPMASYDRWLAVRAEADAVHPQGLFGGFLDLLDGLGWRVTALCELWIADLDLAARDEAPYGRIRKRGEVDKEGMEMWVPLSRPLRSAVRRLLTARGKLGPMAATDPLFPAVGTPGAPWSRHWARTLLGRAEKAAKVPKQEGGNFHPYRRSWATARKDLPVKDVASAGGWRTTRMVELYQQEDPATMLAVVSSRKRVRGLRHGKTPNLGKTRVRPSRKTRPS